MIHLTREVRFSVDRDWAGRIDASKPVHNSWAGWPSAVGLIPYLRVRLTVCGQPHPLTGYLCNIKLLDDLLRQHAIPYAAQELERRGWRLSAEQLLLALWPVVTERVLPPAELERLALCATPFLSFAIDREESDMVQLTQQFEFSAAHRLHCPELSEDENRATFGKCNNPNGHGHNYVVEVTVAGQVDERGAVLALPRFERIVQERVIELLDHKHLNQDTEAFRRLNPSVENIARVVWQMLAPHVAPARLHCVRVYETPKTWAEVRGP